MAAGGEVSPGRRRAEVGDPELQLVYAVTLMAVLGVSSVTPAFPRIVEAFDLGPGSVGLLVTLYTLPGIVLSPLAGVLADRFGRKVILVPSLLLFGLAGGACALARDFDLLLALRLLQGVGAAPLGLLNVTLIGDLYSGRQRTAALGYNSGVLNVGTASYPAVGGAMAMLGWHYPFYLPLLAIPVGLLVMVRLDEPAPQVGPGAREYVRRLWETARTGRALLFFGVSFATFFLLFGSYLTFLPLLMEESFGSSTLVIGLVLSVGSVASGLTSAFLGRLATVVSEERMMGVGFGLYAVCLLVIPLAPSAAWLLPPAALFGIANALNIPNLLSLVTALAPTELRAALVAGNWMFLRAGQTVGPMAMAGAVALWDAPGAFYAGAGIAAVVCLAVASMLEPRPDRPA